MKKNWVLGLPCLVTVQSFTVFPEYFLSISIIYVLIVVILITYNIYGIMLQKALSECTALILVMVSYLIFNDDAIVNIFSNFNHSIINDYLAFFSKMLICWFSAFYFLIVSNFLKEQKLTSFEYLLSAFAIQTYGVYWRKMKKDVCSRKRIILPKLLKLVFCFEFISLSVIINHFILCLLI